MSRRDGLDTGRRGADRPATTPAGGACGTPVSRKNHTSRRTFLSTLAAGSAALAAPPLALARAIEQPASERRAPRPEGVRRDRYALFSPGRIGKLELKNRFCRSAAFEGTGDGGAFVTDDTLRILGSFADGGVSLVLTGYMAVMEYGRPGSQLGAWDDRFIPGLSRVAERVHRAGCLLGAQIGHDGISRGGNYRGRQWHAIYTNPTGGTWPGRISPSGLGGEDDHALTTAEVERFCQDMGRAAYRLQQAGFDCVQIHGAHGYLVDTFLSPRTNRRTDEYGGTLARRVRIVSRIVEEVRDRTGPDFAVVIKVNCFDGETEDHSWPALARALEAAGVDAIDISGPNMMRGNLHTWQDQSFFRPYARMLDVEIPVILGCGNRDVDYLEQIFNEDRGKVDFINLARPLIREPDLVNRWREGRGPARAACTDTSACFRELTQNGTPIECVILRRMKEDQAFVEEYLSRYGA